MALSSSFAMAEHVLWIRQNRTTTPMHILKLVYLCHGWVLGWTGEPLIKERIEAWQYGPVIPKLYHTYKRHGGEQIPSEGKDCSHEIGDGFTKQIVNEVLVFYEDYQALQLSSLTHRLGSPWDTTVRKLGTGSQITDNMIYDYYHKRVKRIEQNN